MAATRTTTRNRDPGDGRAWVRHLPQAVIAVAVAAFVSVSSVALIAAWSAALPAHLILDQGEKGRNLGKDGLAAVADPLFRTLEGPSGLPGIAREAAGIARLQAAEALRRGAAAERRQYLALAESALRLWLRQESGASYGWQYLAEVRSEQGGGRGRHPAAGPAPGHPGG